jgi:hypothetical protein
MTKKLTDYTPMTIAMADEWLKEMAELAELSNQPSQRARGHRFQEIRGMLKRLSDLESGESPQALAEQPTI